MRRAAARKARIDARIRKSNAFARPKHDLKVRDVEALGSEMIRFVVDLLYLAHNFRLSLDGELDVPSSNQMLALRQLALAWPQPIGVAELVTQLGITKQTAATLLIRMRDERLVVESQDPLDGRGKSWWLTARGVRQLRYAQATMERIGRLVLAHQTPEERAAFVTTFRQVRGFAREVANEPGNRLRGRRPRYRKRRAQA